MRIYIIGMPASGKSTVGKELARAKKYKFIDLDKKIVKDNMKSIPEIFKELGEDGFRDLESKALASLQDVDNIVISCGGGIVVRKDNKKLMKGVKVFLDTPLDEIEFRLSRDSRNNRPLSKVRTAKEIYDERISSYEDFKDFKVKSTIISKAVEEIMKGLKKYEKSANN